MRTIQKNRIGLLKREGVMDSNIHDKGWYKNKHQGLFRLRQDKQYSKGNSKDKQSVQTILHNGRFVPSRMVLPQLTLLAELAIC